MGLAATGVAALAIGALLLLRHKEPAPDATSRAEAHTSAAVSPAAVAPPPAAPPPAAEPTGPVQPEVLPALTADKAAPAPAASVTAAAPKARTSARPRTPVAKVAAAVKPSQGGAVDPLDGRK